MGGSFGNAISRLNTNKIRGISSSDDFNFTGSGKIIFLSCKYPTITMDGESFYLNSYTIIHEDYLNFQYDAEGNVHYLQLYGNNNDGFVYTRYTGISAYSTSLSFVGINSFSEIKKKSEYNEITLNIATDEACTFKRSINISNTSGSQGLILLD